jgi:hypothetical protein
MPKPELKVYGFAATQDGPPDIMLISSCDDADVSSIRFHPNHAAKLCAAILGAANMATEIGGDSCIKIDMGATDGTR